MSSSKNIFRLRDFAERVYLSEAQNTIYPPPSYLLHTVCVYTVYLFTREGGEWGGERVEPERRGEGQKFTKLGRKYQHD